MAISKKPSLNYLQTVKSSTGDIKYLLPDVFRRSFYWYSGSYTTPPCSEGVQRFVFSEPISVPASQLRHFKEKVFNSDFHFKGNSKPVSIISLNLRLNQAMEETCIIIKIQERNAQR